MSYAQDQYRLTFWPDVAVPLPALKEVRRPWRPHFHDEGQSLCLLPCPRGEPLCAVGGPRSPAPGLDGWLADANADAYVAQGTNVDLHFQLARLDAGNDKALLDFMHLHGSLWAAQHVPGTNAGSSLLFEPDSPLQERVREGRAKFVPGPRDWSLSWRQEWSWAAAVMSDLIRARHWFVDGVRPAETWASPDWQVHPPASARHAAERTRSHVSGVMASNYFFRVDVEEGAVQDPFSVRGVEVPGWRGAWGLAMGSFWNDLRGRRPYRRCQSATCGNLFLHQLGRAAAGQHRARGNLRYCTVRCANAQAKRDERKKAKQQTKR